jgi:hypothetical protein
MKNIHLIPTNKPSRLFLKENILLFNNQYTLQEVFPKGKCQHIYITSDEEIKEGVWVYNIVSKTKFKATKQLIDLIYNTGVTLTTNKKIILTTDQDLIKDGVQAIDDEFLEWFVNNPSCGEVEVFHQLHKDEPLYNIIIPQEEPKGKTLENPIIIVRNDDKEEFIHLSNGMYRTKWGILNNSIFSTPLEAFDKSKFTFYYEK